MNIAFLFTFLGETGGIPILEENFLSLIARRESRPAGMNFSLITYDRARRDDLPKLFLTRGKMIQNIRAVRKFVKEEKIDIVYYHYHTFPLFLCGVPYAITIHDTNPFNSIAVAGITTLNALGAKGIFSVSQSSKKSISNVFARMGLVKLGRKIAVSRNPLPPDWQKLLEHPDQRLLAPFSLAPQGYFFTLGADDLDFICECATRATALPLAIGGDIKEGERKRLLARYENRLIFTGFVDRPTLAALYANARALIYKNANEGFGYIPLEAAIAGTRIITNPDHSIQEVLGATGEYYTSRKECEMLIENAASNQTRPTRTNTECFSPQRVFQEHITALRAMINKSSH